MILGRNKYINFENTIKEGCPYCHIGDSELKIYGKTIKTDDWENTAGYHKKYIPAIDDYAVDWLEAFILKGANYKKIKDSIDLIKGANDEKAGLMINSGNGYRFVDINYCPFCGRKLNK